MTSSNLDLNPENERICTSRTSMNSFKTAYGNVGLLPGFKYHYAVRIIKGSNFKIGVSSTRHTLDAAFSDTDDGWAYYSGGQLRHGSKGEGPKYGESFQAHDVIGVYIDMQEVRVIRNNCTGFAILL